VTRIKRNRDGVLEQPCDVYIAGKMQNDFWNLPRSKWANPYFMEEDSLDKYAAHVRRKLWDQLDELEGKLLGGWADNGVRCHGCVLVDLLEEKKLKDLAKKFETCGLDVSMFHLEEIRHAYAWADDERVLAYATRLDRTNIFYFQAPVLEGVRHVWGDVDRPHLWPAINADDKILWIVGLYDGPQPLGPFWDDDADLEALERVAVSVGNAPDYPAMPHLVDMFLFAREVQRLIDADPARYKRALTEALRYHTLHRIVVRRVGAVTNVDMDDHDLSKSRIVHVALALWHHWQGTPHPCPLLLELAKKCVRAGHCEVENHHPEYAEVQNDDVDPDKLLVDRLSVHLQKDPNDRQHGWGVDLNYIPAQYLQDWDEFKKTNGHMKLYYECLYLARKEFDAGCDLYMRFPEN